MVTQTFNSIRNEIKKNEMASYNHTFHFPHGGKNPMFSPKNPLTWMIWNNCIKEVRIKSEKQTRKQQLPKIMKRTIPNTKSLQKTKHYALVQNVFRDRDTLSIIESFHKIPTQEFNRGVKIFDAILFSFCFLKCIMINVDIMFHFYWLIRTSPTPTPRDKTWTYTSNMSDTAIAFEKIFVSMEFLKSFTDTLREKAIETESDLGIPGKDSKNLIIEPYWSITPKQKKQQLLLKKNRQNLLFPFQNYSRYNNVSQKQLLKFPHQNYKTFYQELVKKTPTFPYNLEQILVPSSPYLSQQQLRQQRQELRNIRQEQPIHYRYIDSIFFMLAEQTMGLCKILQKLLEFLFNNDIVFEGTNWEGDALINYINEGCKQLFLSTPDLDFCNLVHQ